MPGKQARAILTIVMYHYVRDLEQSRFPAIKGLRTLEFREQLGYIRAHYQVVTMEDVIGAYAGAGDLPANAMLLTFDDGYADGFQTVFPILEEAGVQGSFFPVVEAVSERRVLDANKIHFILASAADPSALASELLSLLGPYRGAHVLKTDEEYLRVTAASRWDPAEVIFVKRMLQRDLPEVVRREIVDELFRRYVTSDEQAFARELYMDVQQLRVLIQRGMYVGSHGVTHRWLTALSEAQRLEEISGSLSFLASIGAPTHDWVMCYPYGASDDALLASLRARGCAIGLTTSPNLATPSHDPLLLPRIDTNDLPKHHAAPPNDWTLSALTGSPT